jgi:choline-glycine betaine transporter
MLARGTRSQETQARIRNRPEKLCLLSELNIWLSLLLLVLFLIIGPTGYLLGLYVTSIGDYLWNVIPMGFWTDPDPSRDWQSWWTIFYWGWWVAWCPFVGIFIARVSRGRTIREFVAADLSLDVYLRRQCALHGAARHGRHRRRGEPGL